MLLRGGEVIESEALIKKITSAKAGDKKAMEEIVTSFTPFVIKAARSIYVRGYELQDLIQIGGASVIKAVNMYDAAKGSKFTSYVFSAVRINFYNLIRTNAKRNYECSINSLNNEGFELIDSIASEENVEEDMVKKEEKLLLNRALNKLSELEKEIIYWFYFENRTLNDYANFKEVCYRTAVDRKKKALTKLKKYLKEMGYCGNL